MGRPLHEKFRFVQTRLHELGLRLHPESRLGREARVFFNAQGELQPVSSSDPRFDDAREALRDYTLFEFILDNWPFSQRDTGAAAKLRTSLKDAVDPYAESRVTPGRDTQLELYVAVALHRAGLPIQQGTPDIRTKLDGRYFYVEAKRPKTQDGIRNAVRQAAGQIQDSGCPGAVFLDVSLAFNPTKGYITRAMPDEEFRLRYDAAFRRAIDPVVAGMVEVIGDKPISTICLQDHQVRRVHQGWTLESSCMTVGNANPGMLKLGRLFERSLKAAWPR